MTMTTIKKAMAAVMAVALLAVAAPVSAQQGSVLARVQAFQTVETTVWLPAGWHHITVDGDGDTDLDLYVYDLQGNLLAVDNDYTDYCIGQFFLSQGRYVRIQIRNLGDVWNEYLLTVR
jgi:hypothetical protein